MRQDFLQAFLGITRDGVQVGLPLLLELSGFDKARQMRVGQSGNPVPIGELRIGRGGDGRDEFNGGVVEAQRRNIRQEDGAVTGLTQQAPQGKCAIDHLALPCRP